MKIACLSLAAVALTGCMGRSVSSGGAPEKNTYIYVTVWPQGPDGKRHSYGLPCRGGGGEFSSGSGTKPFPHPRRACRKLLALSRGTFAPVPKDVACTQVYGGPQVATAFGQIRSRGFSARFARTNGCEIHRWNKVRFLFPGT